MDIWLRSAPAAKALAIATASEFMLEQIRDSGGFTLSRARQRGSDAPVLVDPGGEPLDRILDRTGSGNSMCLGSSSCDWMATALGHLHQHGLVHKDVKPENVLVALEPSGEAGHVWLTGFGLASPLPRERQAPAPPEFIAGTLAYMSPEQTGHMNRSIGATCITGSTSLPSRCPPYGSEKKISPCS
jgi:serine/threonine protein kinase